MVQIKKVFTEDEVIDVVKEGEGEENSIISNLKEKINPTKRVDLTIDNTIEDIVKYQDKGYELFFVDSDEKFLQLSEDEVKELNLFNKQKYNIACGIRYRTLRLDEIKHAHKVFKPRAGFASATDRLEIRGGDPSMHRFWKRPDELQKVAYEGGRVCKDPSVITFGGTDEDGRSATGGTSHTVSADGIDELVLCETPKERNIARRKAVEAKSQNRNRAVDESAKNEIAKLGGATQGF